MELAQSQIESNKMVLLSAYIVDVNATFLSSNGGPKQVDDRDGECWEVRDR